MFASNSSRNTVPDSYLRESRRQES